MKGYAMSTISHGKIRVVRLLVTRNVEQSAEITIELEDADYEDIKSGKLDFQAFFDRNFENSTGYDSIGWLETDASKTKVKVGEVGAFHAQEFFL